MCRVRRASTRWVGDCAKRSCRARRSTDSSQRRSRRNAGEIRHLLHLRQVRGRSCPRRLASKCADEAECGNCDRGSLAEWDAAGLVSSHLDVTMDSGLDSIAPGDQGLILRYDGQQWSVVPTTGPVPQRRGAERTTYMGQASTVRRPSLVLWRRQSADFGFAERSSPLGQWRQMCLRVRAGARSRVSI
jgi:hypothetical protein